MKTKVISDKLGRLDVRIGLVDLPVTVRDEIVNMIILVMYESGLLKKYRWLQDALKDAEVRKNAEKDVDNGVAYIYINPKHIK